MKKIVITLTMIILLSLPVSALADKLVFATTDWPPYIISGKDKPTGMDVEIVLEVCKRLGIEPKIHVLPWKRAIQYAKNGNADAIFAIRKTEERAKFLYYPSDPINLERTVILTQKGSGVKVAGPDDLKGKKVGVVMGYKYGPKFDSNTSIKKMESDSDKQLVNVFAKKRISLAAGIDEGTMRYLCKKAGIETEVLLVLNEVPSYIAFSKTKGEKGKAMAEKIGKTIGQLRNEGVIKKIQDKYF